MKTRRIGTKNYYMLTQTQKLISESGSGDNHICNGCALFDSSIQTGVKCPEDRGGEFICCSNGTDYIFVPATRKGLAGYVAHKLEHS